MDELFKFKDGALLNIETEGDYTSGCPTCNYGAVYTDSIRFKLTTMEIEVDVKNWDEKGLSLSFLMKWTIANIPKFKLMTEAEFFEYLKTGFVDEVRTIPKYSPEFSDRVSFDYYLNGKHIYEIRSDHDKKYNPRND